MHRRQSARNNSMRFKRVTLLSGDKFGEQRKLRAAYDSASQFVHYSEMYNLHGRIGYKTPQAAWKANPTIQSGTNPSDFCRVDKLGRRYRKQDASWGAGNLSRL